MRLEKPRDGKDAPRTQVATPGRFGERPQQQPEGEGAEGEPQQPALDRFRNPGATAPSLFDGPTLEADLEPAEAQPFVRCALCEADSSRFAKRCTNCGTLLDTPDQRIFNDRLWTQRQDESRKLETELVNLRARGAAADLDASEQRKLGEALAREVGDRERQRLSWMEDHSQGTDRRETPGLRLLRLIPSTRLRLAVALCLLAVGAWFAYSFVTASSVGQRVVPTIFFWAVIALFVPGRRRRRRRWWQMGD